MSKKKKSVRSGSERSRAPEKRLAQGRKRQSSTHADTGMLGREPESKLSLGTSYWFLGEWQALAKLTEQDISHDAHRDRLAVLVASAHQQIGQTDEARHYARLALQWGRPPRAMLSAR